ncbi:MAG: DUF2905 domain-containing protein [Bdellovibrio sp.]|nr:MAG: DUF2905 domain-containing protein [Bdellovibrio sp.]
MNQDFGRLLIAVGVALMFVGIFVLFGDKIPGLGRLGRLPGDFMIERPNFQFYFPLTTSILVSLLLTFLYWLLRR